MTLTLPLRLLPVVGEGLDSWLTSFAFRAAVPMGDLLEQAGIEQSHAAWLPAAVASSMSDDDVKRLAAVTGASIVSLGGLRDPLANYLRDTRHLYHTVGCGFFATVMQASRYCPLCLADGRWQASWRIGWMLACPLHEALLQTTCPRCGARQRRRNRTGELPPPPWRCDEPSRPGGGRRPQLCGFDLRDSTAQPTVRPLLELARHCQRLLASATVGVSEKNTTFVSDLIELGELTAVDTRLRSQMAAFEQPGPFAQVVATAATALLRPDSPEFSSLAQGPGEATRRRAVPRSWSRVSPQTTQQALRLRDGNLRGPERLRWRTTLDQPLVRLPMNRPAVATDRLPASMWPTWSARLQPPDLTSTAVFPSVAIVALMLPGSAIPLPDLCRLAPSGVRGADVNRCLREINSHPNAYSVLRGLTLLSDALVAKPAPIDYARRRQLASCGDLLTREEWRDISATAGVSMGDERRHLHASLWMWETITGGSFAQAPALLDNGDGMYFLAYQEFLRSSASPLFQAMRQHALEWLGRHGVDDEPLEWEPQVDRLLQPKPWPGIDIENPLVGDRLKVLLAGQGSLRQVAQVAGCKYPVLSALVRSGRLAPVRHPELRARPTVATLREMVETQRLPLRQAADALGVSRETLGRWCKRAAIPVPPTGRPRRWRIDPEWLKHEYVDRHRSLADIAHEVGCSDANVARVAVFFDIPLRPRGGHHWSIPIGTDTPALLARCLRQEGIGALRHFLVLVDCRSVQTAATTIGTSCARLQREASWLELAARGDLFDKAVEGRRLIPTPLGERLYRQVIRHIGAGSATMTGAVSRVLDLRGGSRRLSMFAHTARYATIYDAADALDTDVQRLTKRLRALQGALGEPVFNTIAPRARLELTNFGVELARQAQVVLGVPGGSTGDPRCSIQS